MSLGPLPLLLRLLALTALFARPAAAGFDPVKDAECESADSICLTSFRWCSRNSQSGKGCYFPDGVDPFFPADSVAYAMLYHGNKYDITWKQAKPGVPVLIEWLFSEDLYQSFDHAQAVGNGRLGVRWSTSRFSIFLLVSDVSSPLPSPYGLSDPVRQDLPQHPKKGRFGRCAFAGAGSLSGLDLGDSFEKRIPCPCHGSL
jgi:hypothetical protein